VIHRHPRRFRFIEVDEIEEAESDDDDDLSCGCSSPGVVRRLRRRRFRLIVGDMLPVVVQLLGEEVATELDAVIRVVGAPLQRCQYKQREKEQGDRDG